ncbi:AAA family ATPase [Actinomadura barringtoniae]|uniref:AAA family ATPase n=1 Tax=Actinomadura barringtoniae TaxID=1427535 RepID=A0A939PDA6_9ACTN|nr:LuxR family transcriptional regulator [Actinomadura barringtoniae]MBO2450122.1 AAA family ATPase [Actinomadura barringtoniae]
MSVFVNRGRQLAALRQAFQDAGPGRCRIAVLSGPPGIGKTAMAERFAATAVNATVLRACGAEEDTGLAFGLTHQLIGSAEPDTLYEAIERSQDGPVVVVVDDAQWADHPSLQAICSLPRRVRTASLLIVMIVRDPGDPGLPGAVHRILGADGTLRIALTGLDEDAVRDLCAELTGHRPSRRAARRLRQHTEGNPRHLRALLAEVSPESVDELDVPLPVPRSVAAPVLAALDACTPAAQGLIGATAVLDERCPLHLAAAVAEVAEPLTALEEAIGSGLLAEEIGTGHIRFRSPLTREAVYQEHLGPVRRAALHERAAAAVPDRAARLWHRARSTVGPDADLATELGALGHRHATTGHWPEAARYLGAAAGLAPDAAARERLDLEASECLISVGEADQHALARRLHELAPSPWRDYVQALLELNAGRIHSAATLLTELQRASDSDGIPHARINGHLRFVRHLQHRTWSAASLADPDDLDGVRRRVIAHLQRAEQRWLSGDWDEALSEGNAGGALAAGGGQALLVPLCEAGQVPLLAARGEWDAAEARLRAARDRPAAETVPLVSAAVATAAAHLAAARGDDDQVLRVSPTLPSDLVVDALITLGRLDEAETVLDRLRANAVGRPLEMAAAARVRGGLHAARRETRQAVAAFENSLDVLDGLRAPFLTALTRLGFGAFLRRAGRRGAAAAHLEPAHVGFEALGARPYLARCARELAACGRPGGGRSAGESSVGLTAQESAVAGRAARGLTNRQIAREMVISVKTVEYHLGNIYPKLRVRSRTELAVRMAGG